MNKKIYQREQWTKFSYLHEDQLQKSKFPRNVNNYFLYSPLLKFFLLLTTAIQCCIYHGNCACTLFKLIFKCRLENFRVF